MENIAYLVTGYLVVWSGLFLYLWRICVLHKNLMERLSALEEARAYSEGQKGADHE
jgi:CcmD family protein